MESYKRRWVKIEKVRDLFDCLTTFLTLTVICKKFGPILLSSLIIPMDSLSIKR
jgi:hypothetical protein